MHFPKDGFDTENWLYKEIYASEYNRILNISQFDGETHSEQVL